MEVGPRVAFWSLDFGAFPRTSVLVTPVGMGLIVLSNAMRPQIATVTVFVLTMAVALAMQTSMAHLARTNAHAT
jgi:hypothetical protein